MSLESLERLRIVAQEQKDRAEGQIRRLRKNINSIEKDICTREGERDAADLLLDNIESEIEKETKAQQHPPQIGSAFQGNPAAFQGNPCAYTDAEKNPQ